MQTSSGARAAVLSTELSGTACPGADRAGSSGCRPGLGLTMWGKAVPNGESRRGHRFPRTDPEVLKMERHLLVHNLSLCSF